MPSEERQTPATPPCTWRPMVAWTLGILVALGLAWFVGAVVVPMWPVWQVQLAVDRLVRSGYDDDVRRKQIVRLGGNEATAHKVTRYLQASRRSTLQRSAALTLLEYSSTREAIPGLIILAGDEEPGIRGGAVELLSDEYEADARSFGVLAAALADEQADDFTRSWASRGLARIEDPRCAELMVAALRTRNEAVREAVVLNLKQLGSPRTAELLEPLLKDEDEEVRNAAEELLKEFR